MTHYLCWTQWRMRGMGEIPQRPLSRTVYVHVVSAHRRSHNLGDCHPPPNLDLGISHKTIRHLRLEKMFFSDWTKLQPLNSWSCCQLARKKTLVWKTCVVFRTLRGIFDLLLQQSPLRKIWGTCSCIGVSSHEGCCWKRQHICRI